MNAVTASFNTTVRHMTEISHDKMSQQKMTEMSQQKITEHLSSGVDRGLNQGDKT